MAGLACGLTYGLAAWGYDAWVLARSSAEWAWFKFGLGLPLLLLVGAAAGRLAGRSRGTGGWVGAWMAGGVLMGATVGGMPFVGQTLAAWIAAPRLWGLNVYPMGPAGTARLAFVAVASGCVGSAAGLLGYLGAERARQRAGPGDRRWAGPAALCLLLTAGAGLIGDEVVNGPPRAGLRAVHTALTAGAADVVGRAEPGALRDQPAASYRLHVVDRGVETAGQATIDVGLPDGLVVRCQTAGRALTGCAPMSPRFEAWMDALVQEGLSGGTETELLTPAGRVSARAEVPDWLASQRGAMGGGYAIWRDAQHGGWVTMAARFDNAYVLRCDFHAIEPVVVYRCSGSPRLKPSG